MRKKKLIQRIKDAWAVLLGKKHAKAYRQKKEPIHIIFAEHEKNEILPGVEG